jgi:hypothetical protein|nr:MAG TPA: hypothetical protein [Ackermannviridae sp.]
MNVKTINNHLFIVTDIGLTHHIDMSLIIAIRIVDGDYYIHLKDVKKPLYIESRQIGNLISEKFLSFIERTVKERNNGA